MSTIRLSGNFADRDQTPSKIVYWYDKNQRLWATRLATEDGQEIGDGHCDYYSSEKILMETEARFNPGLPLEKLKAGSR